MVGLPYVGTVAACAGKVVAMASPNDMPERFNWARVLKHEFVHVMNLQQTDFNVSHWFTEALAVRNEGYPRPPLWNKVLAQRAAANQLYDLDTINMGFARPASGEDWTLAYCQADMYAQYMLDTYGDDALAKMLAAYADNLNTSGAIRRCFATSQQQFEAGYRQYIQRTVSGLALGDPPRERGIPALETAVKNDHRDADSWGELAYAYLQKRMYPQAGQAAQAARKIAPRQQLAAYVLARLQLLIGNTQQAIQLLDESLDKHSPQQDLLGLLAALKLKSQDIAAAEELTRLGADTFPDDDKWLKALARLYLESGQNDKLAGPLERLAEFDPDSLSLRKKLAQLALVKQDFAAAARWANQGLHIDVLDASVHALLAQALAGKGQHADAIEQYETALRLDPRQAAWRFALANAYAEAMQRELAGKALQELLKTDPDFPGANELLEKLRS
jgi:tetratricopeptide (TPR) repeat protein